LAWISPHKWTSWHRTVRPAFFPTLFHLSSSVPPFSDAAETPEREKAGYHKPRMCTRACDNHCPSLPSCPRTRHCKHRSLFIYPSHAICVEVVKTRHTILIGRVVCTDRVDRSVRAISARSVAHGGGQWWDSDRQLSMDDLLIIINSPLPPMNIVTQASQWTCFQSLAPRSGRSWSRK
jgi:hypothetical protein